MKCQGMIGVGCYGRPETLTRVLKKCVEKYILENTRGPDRRAGLHCVQFETIRLLTALIGGLPESHQFSEPEIIENIKKSDITGFFLAVERRGLNLSIFTRHGQSMNSMNLEDQTKIEKTCLH